MNSSRSSSLFALVRKLTAAVTISAGLLTHAAVLADTFQDVGVNAWYAPYVQELVDTGVLDGSRPVFSPAQHVTRDVAAKILVKAIGVNPEDLVTPTKPSFKDVPKTSWAYSYVETARSLGFVTGYPDGTFGPGRDVTRAEFASMIMRAFQLETSTNGAPHFTDVKSKSWFFNAVETVYRWSIVDGYDVQIFKPYNSINRAEMSKMIVAAIHLSARDEQQGSTPMYNPAPVVPPANNVPNPTYIPPVYAPPVVVVPPPVVVTPTLVTPAPTPTPTTFADTFSGFTPHYVKDGEAFGPWLDQFGGYGTVGIEGDGTNQWLRLSPMVSDAPNKTSASLVTGPSYNGPLQFQAKMTTLQQLRTGSTPNTWEVAWMVWNYTDNDHFYYFIPKTNGWELGKRDPVYPGGQRFLATGSSPAFPIGQPYTVKITQDASNTMSVWVNGALITTFTDTEHPYTSGKIGFYTEDALIHVDDVSVTN